MRFLTTRTVLLWIVGLGLTAAVVALAIYAVTFRERASSAPELLHDAMRLADLNNWPDAEPEFRKVADIFRKNGDQRGALYAQLGIIRATVKNRNLPDTVTQLDDMLGTEPLLKLDSDLRMFCLIIRGEIAGEMKSGAMRKDWEEVTRLAKELGDAKWQNRARAEIGFAAFYDGDIATAKKNVLTSLLVAFMTHDTGEEIKLLYAIGLGMDNQKSYDTALVFLNKAISLSRNTPGAPYPFMILIAKASALAHMGRNAEAAKILAEVQTGARHKRALVYEAAALTTAAEINLSRGNFTGAKFDYRKAEYLLASGGYQRGLIETQLALARVYLKQHDLRSAAEELRRATNNMQVSGELERLPEQLQTLATLRINEGDFKDADHLYDKAEAFIDAAIYGDPSVLDKTTWINSTSELYVQHFALLADHFGNVAKAFSVIEQVRGRVTTDVLLGGLRLSDAAKQNEHTISQARLELRSTNTPEEVRRVNDRLFLLEQRRWITPEISILKTRARSQLPLSRIQHALSNRTAILEYVLSDPNSYCLVITRVHVRIIQLASRDRIENLVTTYLTAVKARRPATGIARGLYGELIAPIGEAVALSNLLIVRDGELHLLPFESLIDSDGVYLNDRFVVSYLPSAGSFYLLAQKASEAQKTSHALLAVGGVAYRTDQDQLKNLILVPGGNPVKLVDLPMSKDEVQIAKATFPGSNNDVLTGTGATKSAFKHEPLADFRVLHLAVHGLVERDRLDRAALVLLDDPKAGEDGLLQAPEIAQLPLRADLVVLSACETAIGKIQGQEGIETLAHSFVIAGARSVISTLWSIDDSSSLALIKQFYQHYRTSGSAADALALAKRDTLRQYGHDVNPFYWAAFTFEGVPKSAVSNYDFTRDAN